MRVLFLTCQPPHHMAPPRLGDEQIDCGPCFIDHRIAGRWITRTTPFGPFDVSILAAELAAEGQTPDVVVCHVDCGFCLKPVNLDVFRCPKILLAADSHWGENAISGLVNYAAGEPFDRVVLLYDRHHAEFYRAAGIRNLHWFPGLTFAHPDTRIQAATTANAPRGTHLALVGKVGYHARRQRLFAALIRAGVPLAWAQLRQSELVAHYASSLIGLNAAMNGDLNLRVFETLAGGAMLLTDRLAPASGLDEILAEGREKISYDHADDLVAKARHYLAHPDEARAIGAATAGSWRISASPAAAPPSATSSSTDATTPPSNCPRQPSPASISARRSSPPATSSTSSTAIRKPSSCAPTPPSPPTSIRS